MTRFNGSHIGFNTKSAISRYKYIYMLNVLNVCKGGVREEWWETTPKRLIPCYRRSTVFNKFKHSGLKVRRVAEECATCFRCARCGE